MGENGSDGMWEKGVAKYQNPNQTSVSKSRAMLIARLKYLFFFIIHWSQGQWNSPISVNIDLNKFSFEKSDFATQHAVREEVLTETKARQCMAFRHNWHQIIKPVFFKLFSYCAPIIKKHWACHTQHISLCIYKFCVNITVLMYFIKHKQNLK